MNDLKEDFGSVCAWPWFLLRCQPIGATIAVWFSQPLFVGAASRWSPCVNAQINQEFRYDRHQVRYRTEGMLSTMYLYHGSMEVVPSVSINAKHRLDIQ